MTKIILFNGPPSSGKDTLATMVQTQVEGAEVVKFAAPLKNIAKHLYCEGDSKLFYTMDQPERKNQPHPLFFGKTCREVQIAISEVYMKPVHGGNVLGKVLASYIEKNPHDSKVFLVSDSGFVPEAQVLIEEFGEQNILLIRLHREGFDFSNDSRDYIDLKGVETHDVSNNTGDVNQALNNVLNVVTKFLG